MPRSITTAVLGDFAFAGPNATLGGAVIVGDGAFIGIGASILPNLKIGTSAIVGAGAVVVRDVPRRRYGVGVPARRFLTSLLPPPDPRSLTLIPVPDPRSCGYICGSRRPLRWRRSDPAMTNLARHRGPDDEGYLLVRAPGATLELLGGGDTPSEAYRSGAPFAPSAAMTTSDQPVTLAFGHRRLSILDLSALGHQPMCTSDRRIWMVYNGEIYNYAELAAELKALGYNSCRTRQRGDCGGLCDLGLREPRAAERHVRIRDLRHVRPATVFLVRDRFGIKPMYYWIAPDGTFHFASEIKQFTAVLGWTSPLNVTRAQEFLRPASPTAVEETMFAGVYHLPPGHSATVSIYDGNWAPGSRLPARRYVRPHSHAAAVVNRSHRRLSRARSTMQSAE